MREDLGEALDVALRENLFRHGRLSLSVHQEVTSRRRERFLARLRIFLQNCPDELSIEELREEIAG